MLTTCQEPGCTTIVMGGRCLEHERHPARVFVRGRPFTGSQPDTFGTGYGVASVGTTGVASRHELAESAQLAYGIPRR